MKLTPKKQDELYNQMAQRQGQRVRDIEPQSIAARMYPNLKPKAEDEQPKRSPVDGWAKQRKEWE
jgi:hypothetical protein